MTTIITDPQTAGQTPGCPSWCIGRHARPEPQWADADAVWHLAASCPSWCTGHCAGEPEFEEEGHSGHTGHATEVALSLAKPYEAVTGRGANVMLPDTVNVQIWKQPGSPEPVVAIEHGATNNWLPDMVPGEAFALGLALIRAAWSLDPAAAAAATGPDPAYRPGHPAWCAETHQDDWDLHLGDHHEVPCHSTAPAGEHICIFTSCDDPKYDQESCEEPVWTDLVLSRDSTYVYAQVGHGDTPLPGMRLPDAERLAISLIGLAAVARESAPESP
jgi:hypothetical protein